MPKRSLRSVRGGKLYGAAFPLLDSLVVERAWAEGRSCCQWTNECGVVVGHVAIQDLAADRMVMTTRFLGAVNVGYRFGEDVLAIRRSLRNENHDRPSFGCPQCGRTVQTVFAVAGRWACRHCHDLVSIGRLLGPVTRYQRRLMELEVLLKGGRPRYARKAAYAALQQEHGRLLGEFSHAPPLPAELRFAQQAEWMRPGDPRLKQQVLDGEEGYGWTRFDEGGFRRLTWLANQERQIHGHAELATRGRPSASTVRPLGQAGPNVTHAPFAAETLAAPEAPRSDRLDFSSWMEPSPEDAE